MLAASGTAVLAVAAACSSGGSPSGTTSASSSASSPASSPPSAPASSPAAGSTSAPAAVSPTTAAATPEAPPAPAQDPPAPTDPVPTGPVLASVADVESAGAVVVGDGADPHLLAYAGGTVVAHTAICTHQGCTIAASGRCPCHGSRFDVATGAVLSGPAQRPLAELPVTVSGGQVYAG